MCWLIWVKMSIIMCLDKSIFFFLLHSKCPTSKPVLPTKVLHISNLEKCIEKWIKTVSFKEYTF